MIKKTIDGIFIPKSGELEYGVSFVLFQKDNYKQLFEAVENFYSGNDILDEFIREAHRHTECISYLFMKDREVLAYCSMSCSAIFINSGVSPLPLAMGIQAADLEKDICEFFENNRKDA